MICITTDKSEIDIPLVHNFLSNESTWASGIPREIVERGIENSLCFAGFLENKQVAFARVISDFATFANLVDVFVLQNIGTKVTAKLLWNLSCHILNCKACGALL